MKRENSTFFAKNYVPEIHTSIYPTDYDELRVLMKQYQNENNILKKADHLSSLRQSLEAFAAEKGIDSSKIYLSFSEKNNSDLNQFLKTLQDLTQLRQDYIQSGGKDPNFLRNLDNLEQYYKQHRFNPYSKNKIQTKPDQISSLAQNIQQQKSQLSNILNQKKNLLLDNAAFWDYKKLGYNNEQELLFFLRKQEGQMLENMGKLNQNSPEYLISKQNYNDIQMLKTKIEKELIDGAINQALTDHKMQQSTPNYSQQNQYQSLKKSARSYLQEEGLILRFDFVTELPQDAHRVLIRYGFFQIGQTFHTYKNTNYHQADYENYRKRRAIIKERELIANIQPSADSVMYCELWLYESDQIGVEDDVPKIYGWSLMQLFDHNRNLRDGKFKIPFYNKRYSPYQLLEAERIPRGGDSWCFLRVCLPLDRYLDTDQEVMVENQNHALNDLYIRNDDYVVPQLHLNGFAGYAKYQYDKFTENNELEDDVRIGLSIKFRSLKWDKKPKHNHKFQISACIVTNKDNIIRDDYRLECAFETGFIFCDNRYLRIDFLDEMKFFINYKQGSTTDLQFYVYLEDAEYQEYVGFFKTNLFVNGIIANGVFAQKLYFPPGDQTLDFNSSMIEESFFQTDYVVKIFRYNAEKFNTDGTRNRARKIPFFRRKFVEQEFDDYRPVMLDKNIQLSRQSARTDNDINKKQKKKGADDGLEDYNEQDEQVSLQDGNIIFKVNSVWGFKTKKDAIYTGKVGITQRDKVLLDNNGQELMGKILLDVDDVIEGEVIFEDEREFDISPIDIVDETPAKDLYHTFIVMSVYKDENQSNESMIGWITCPLFVYDEQKKSRKFNKGVFKDFLYVNIYDQDFKSNSQNIEKTKNKIEYCIYQPQDEEEKLPYYDLTTNKKYKTPRKKKI